jgi:small subunit ribosomal protein S20
LTLPERPTISGAELAARLSPPLAFYDIELFCDIEPHQTRGPTAARHTRAGMANTTSAQKAARKIARRTEVNKARRSQLRGSVRKVEEAIVAGDRGKALAALKEAEPVIMRSAQKGVVHRNAASRKVSRLSHQIAKLGA